ncbi:hypothetical protein [Endozoicomonas ascidiicola]|uniref:hypothetical protein n=1 Tax=Endozoicomonas ascidiicola TaxID=1698521 RepID=UPI00082ABC07|nr:hypothetical protein [Endozoicomonas ascidiicola]
MGTIWKAVVWLVVLGITAGLTVAFGPVGFVIGLILCWVQSSSFRRREQNKQHKELMETMKGRKG